MTSLQGFIILMAVLSPMEAEANISRPARSQAFRSRASPSDTFNSWLSHHVSRTSRACSSCFITLFLKKESPYLQWDFLVSSPPLPCSQQRLCSTKGSLDLHGSLCCLPQQYSAAPPGLCNNSAAHGTILPPFATSPTVRSNFAALRLYPVAFRSLIGCLQKSHCSAALSRHLLQPHWLSAAILLLPSPHNRTATCCYHVRRLPDVAVVRDRNVTLTHWSSCSNDHSLLFGGSFYRASKFPMLTDMIGQGLNSA